MTRLAVDDCTPDWPVVEPPARPAGTRYHVRLRSDLWGQQLHARRTSRIVTIPITGEYL